MKVVIFLIGLLGFVESFVPLVGPKGHTTVALRTSPTSSYDDVLTRLQNEYKQLQQELMDDLVTKHDKVAAEDVAGKILEKAAEETAVQKYKQEEILDQARVDMVAADDELQHVRTVQAEAHDVGVSAQHEAQLLESIDAAYEDLERLRDMSVVHASQQLEDDMKDVEIENTFRVLEAEDREFTAMEKINELDANLVRLKANIKQLKDMKHEKSMNLWEKGKNKN